MRQSHLHRAALLGLGACLLACGGQEELDTDSARELVQSYLCQEDSLKQNLCDPEHEAWSNFALIIESDYVRRAIVREPESGTDVARPPTSTTAGRWPGRARPLRATGTPLSGRRTEKAKPAKGCPGRRRGGSFGAAPFSAIVSV